MSNSFLLASVLDQGLSLANVKHPLDPPLFLTTHPHLHHLLLLPKDSLRCQPPAHRRQPTTMQQHTIVYSPVPHIDHLSLSLRLHKRIHPPLHSWRRNRKRAHRLDSAARLRWRLNNESRVRAAQDVLVDDHVGTGRRVASSNCGSTMAAFAFVVHRSFALLVRSYGLAHIARQCVLTDWTDYLTNAYPLFFVGNWVPRACFFVGSHWSRKRVSENGPKQKVLERA